MTVDPYLPSNLAEISLNPRAAMEFVKLLAADTVALEFNNEEAQPLKMIGFVNYNAELISRAVAAGEFDDEN